MMFFLVFTMCTSIVHNGKPKQKRENMDEPILPLEVDVEWSQKNLVKME